MPAATLAQIDASAHRAVIFDLDGVITDTASVHRSAWARLFDNFFTGREPAPGEDPRPFTTEDYLRWVDGKPREQGARDFLTSRGVRISAAELGALAERKDAYFLERLEREGVRPYPGAVRLIRFLHEADIPTGVVTASRNGAAVLERAGLADLISVRVDGCLVAELGLPGKPDPAAFLLAARLLGVGPRSAVVIEDAEAGVEAARQGGFGLIVGVGGAERRDALTEHGADVVVEDLGDVAVLTTARTGRRRADLDPASTVWAQRASERAGRTVAVTADFDGTLAPIVDRPDRATLPAAARAVLARLAAACPVAVISGRDLADLSERVAVAGIWHAGSHGLEIAGPDGQLFEHPSARNAAGQAADAAAELTARLAGIPGLLVEPKRFSVAVHFRTATTSAARPAAETAVQYVAARTNGLRVQRGRMVIELRPDIDWDKGHALRWVLSQLTSAAGGKVPYPVYAGDDLTDEDALAVVAEDGFGIAVLHDEAPDQLSTATAAVDGPDALVAFFDELATELGAPTP